MKETQEDVVIAGETVGRLVYNGRDYKLLALDPRLREIDGNRYANVAAAREAAIVMLDTEDPDDAD